jgi:hypothetical protein
MSISTPAGLPKAISQGGTPTTGQDVEMRDVGDGDKRHSPPQAPGGQLQLWTLADLDARVEQAAQSIKYRFEPNGHATLWDPFENKRVTTSTHTNQKRFRQIRIAKNSRSLLIREGRIRSLAERLRRKRLDENAALSALEAARKERVDAEAGLSRAAALHVQLAHNTGSLRLAAIVDAKHSEEKARMARARAAERQQAKALSEEYRSKRRKLFGSALAGAASSTTAPGPKG